MSRPALSLVKQSQDERIALAREKLAAKPDGVIEAIAAETDLPTQAVLELTPAQERIFLPAESFEELWEELSTWGEVLFIVHTKDIVCEVVGQLPVGTFGQGYYNIHGDSPIGGHIRAANCRAIYLVDRPFHGRRSCSVQFFNANGEAMFKVFVRRDKARELLPQQLAKFDALKARSAS
jgi:putative heme utilization carrier protein HutX